LIRQGVFRFLGLEKHRKSQKRSNWSGAFLAGCLACPWKLIMRSYCLSVNCRMFTLPPSGSADSTCLQ